MRVLESHLRQKADVDSSCEFSLKEIEIKMSR